LTATAVVMGTPHYMPPEQFRDSSTVDARADIYSIGVILYEILTGNLPTGVAKPASQILRDVPPALDPIIAKCVEPEPAQRYANVTELKHALMAVMDLLRGGTLESKKAPKPSTMRSGDVVRRVGGGLLIAVVVLMTAVGLYGLEGRRVRQLAEASTSANADPLESIEPQWRTRYQEAIALIDAAKRQTANRQASDADKPIFDRIGVLRNAAEIAEPTEPERALKLAHQTLQCYAAVLMSMPEESYFFVLPGNDVGEDGFFMSRRAVTVREFAAWANSASWRDMTNPAFLESELPMPTGYFYDAQAYAAAKGLRIPSQEEWQRAFAAQPDALVTASPEWTRDVANGEPVPDGLPTFGNILLTVSIAPVEENESPSMQFGQAPYWGSEGIEFRCVVPIDTSPEAMHKVLEQ
jgi:formylglycine-generating enzyme required for sulfatase activity